MKDQVYIIEDDGDVAETYSQALTRHGFACVSFKTAEACLSVVNSGDWPDALIVDYRLPGLSGIEFMKEIRGLGLQCPAIIITGARTDALTLEAITLNIQSIIEKPFAMELIVQKLSRIIGHYKVMTLSSHLLEEFRYFTDCAEHLIKSYKDHIHELESKGLKSKTDLHTLIIQKQSSKWEKELNRSRHQLQELQLEYQRLKKLNEPKSSNTA